MHVGNYTLTDLLGRGGTSEVYAGQHRFLGDAVAVKLLRRTLAEDEHTREAFVAEAARTREIQHPNVVRVLDFGHDDTQGCYLVMERIEGEALSTRLRRVGRIAEPALRELAAAIADGMQAAHARGIVHRDLKPGNVMLRGAGDVPTIVDFGIAKSLGNTTAAVTERRVGTVAYMAPEQLIDGLITPAVDVWALGVIMYEAATGTAPFANFADGRLPQLFETPPRVTAVSPAFADVIASCLERDPGKRPASMAELARRLRGGAEDGERVTEDLGGPIGRPAGSQIAAPVTTPRGPRRTRWVIVGAAAAGVIAVALLVARRGEHEPARVPMTAVPADAAVPETVKPKPAAEPSPSPPGEATAAPASPTRAPARKATRKTTRKQKTTRQGETLD